MEKKKRLKTGAEPTGKITVRVRQAYEETLPGGRFRRLKPDDEIEINEADFSENLHEKI